MSLRSRRWVGRTGPVALVVLVVAYTALWVVARPAGEATGSYVGQLAGADAVLLMSLGMVLITTLPWVDTYFDGIDKAAIWHRRVAITGLLLLVPHILMSHGDGGPSWAGTAGIVGTVGLVTLAVWAILPRWRSIVPAPGRRLITALHETAPARLVSRLLSDYEIWRQVHRLTGVFLAVAAAHGLVDATMFGDSAVLRWSYVGISLVGIGFYLYRELLARRGHGLRDYQVSDVREMGDGMLEIVLRPLGRPLEYEPGQFAMLHLEAKDGWHRHPFTLASSPNEDEVRVTVKALGDYTTSLQQTVKVGMPAVLSGPHGRFTHAHGTGHQLWIAGGVGITPFLSWLRSLDTHPPAGRVDLFHAVRDEAPYAEEIATLVADHPEVEFDLVASSQGRRISAAYVLETSGADPAAASVYMCGPDPLLRALDADFRAAGVPAGRIYREYFDWR